MFSQIKDITHIDRNKHYVSWAMPQYWDLRVLGVKNLSVGICDGAQRLCILVIIVNNFLNSHSTTATTFAHNMLMLRFRRLTVYARAYMRVCACVCLCLMQVRS